MLDFLLNPQFPVQLVAHARCLMEVFRHSLPHCDPQTVSVVCRFPPTFTDRDFAAATNSDRAQARKGRAGDGFDFARHPGRDRHEDGTVHPADVIIMAIGSHFTHPRCCGRWTSGDAEAGRSAASGATMTLGPISGSPCRAFPTCSLLMARTPILHMAAASFFIPNVRFGTSPWRSAR